MSHLMQSVLKVYCVAAANESCSCNVLLAPEREFAHRLAAHISSENHVETKLKGR